MSKYKFKGVVYVDLGSLPQGKHLPYFLCATVEGPKGGIYVLDQFCTEQLLFKLTKNTSFSTIRVVTDKVAEGKLTLSKVSTAVSSDVGVKKYADSVKAIAMIRKEGLPLVEKMAKNFDTSILSV